MTIATVTIQRCHANSPKDVSMRGAKKDPLLFALFVKLHAAAAVWFCPIDATRQNPRIHPIDNDGLKHATNWMHTGRVDNTAKIKNTNQDLVAWPRNIHVDSNNRQSKLCPELVHQCKISAQTQHFNEGRIFSHNPKILVHFTSLVDNDVQGKRILPVSHDQKSP